MITIGVSQARARLTKLVDDIDSRFERVAITKGGSPKAVLMSSDEFEGWLATIEEYADPESLKRARSLNKMAGLQIKKSANFTPLSDLRKEPRKR